MSRDHGIKTCQHCFKEFNAVQHNQKYCGSQSKKGTCAFICKKILTKKYQKEHSVPLKANCKKCGVEFTPYNKRQVLCGSRKNHFGCSYIGFNNYKKKNRRPITLKNYGLTEHSYTLMVEEQEHKCKICQETQTKTMAVDHCHNTGKVRGLLCMKCNTGIGFFKDSKELLLKAINYLELNG